MDKFKDIRRYLDNAPYWEYIGQVQHQRKKTWFLVARDNYNHDTLLVRLLGGAFGTPTGTAQPRDALQIARIYGAIHYTEHWKDDQERIARAQA